MYPNSDVVALSFFSGALGLDLGLEQVGIKARLYCENDNKCRQTIATNRCEVPCLRDIVKITTDDVYRAAGLGKGGHIDVVFGGPPCQAFSTAGTRKAFGDARGNVFLTFIDLAVALEPTYIVIENVRGLLSAEWPIQWRGSAVRGGALYHVLQRLRKRDYQASFELYNAANFGAPQIRERVVLIAKRGGVVQHLIPTHSDTEGSLPAWVTFGEACAGLTRHRYLEFSEKQMHYLSMLSEGECWRDLPEEVQRQAMGKSFDLGGGKTGFYRRIRNDKPCPTLVTSPRMSATCLCHPKELRPLSVEEYKRVQGFPDSWLVYGSLADKYRQLGNAVPIALGRAIGHTLLADMSGEKGDARWETFAHSRYKHTNEVTWAVG